MKRVMAFVWHVISAMLKGFFYAGFAAATACAVVLFITEPNHQLSVDTSALFSLAIALLAGTLGAAVALIYHLSHLDGIHHSLQQYSEQRAAQRQQRMSAY